MITLLGAESLRETMRATWDDGRNPVEDRYSDVPPAGLATVALSAEAGRDAGREASSSTARHGAFLRLSGLSMT